MRLASERSGSVISCNGPRGLRVLIDVSKEAIMTSAVDGVEESEVGRLADLYVRHAPAGLRLAYLLTGDRQVAEDLLQDAFVKLAGRLRHLRQPDAFEAYLRRTIVNLCNNRFRRSALERAQVEREKRVRGLDVSQPDVPLEQDMRRALLGLPQRQRAAIVLRFYEDLSERETADLLRCRPATVRSLLFRAMRVLRADLEGQTDDG
jgi:RNA polymerase sigma factor (sigma-70 family)